MPTTQIPVHSDQSVRLSSHFGILVREDAAFTNRKGVEKKGIRKRVEQALGKLQEPLRKILEPDEAVLYITRGQLLPGMFEQFFLGWYVAYLAPATLVLTNRRLLYLSVKRNGSWNRGVRSARWGDLESAKIKAFFSPKLHIKYRDGKKEVYWRLRGDDGKKIRLLLEVLLPTGSGETSPAHSMSSLCPECLAALTPGVYECPHCRLKFKDEKTLLRRSLLIPGGGFFYTGHAFLGALHFLVELLLLLEVVLWGAAVVGLWLLTPSTGQAHADRGAALATAAILAVLLALHKGAITRIARNLVRNYIPVS
jgi:hypothetical protein